jgi:hypothetical protein
MMRTLDPSASGSEKAPQGWGCGWKVSVHFGANRRHRQKREEKACVSCVVGEEYDSLGVISVAG